jgi:glycosyltransferase involved in cell wall biosynthesis
MQRYLKMTEPLISVLLPCRNGARTVGVAIASLLDQTFSDFEIIFLNDGSTDTTVKIVSNFKDPRIRLCGSGVGIGLPARLNQGVALARGKFIARMDADDLCFTTRFERQVEFLDRHAEVDLVGCRALVFLDDGQTIGLLPSAATHVEICAQPWRNFPLPHPGWMGRREWFERNAYQIPEVRRAEDQELLLRTHRHSRFACLEDVLLAYRQGEFQLRRTLIARRSLCAAQSRYFLQHREMANLLRAWGLTGLKIMVDLLTSLPKLNTLYLLRIGEPVAASLRQEFHTRLRQCGALRQ